MRTLTTVAALLAALTATAAAQRPATPARPSTPAQPATPAPQAAAGMQASLPAYLATNPQVLNLTADQQSRIRQAAEQMERANTPFRQQVETAIGGRELRSLSPQDRQTLLLTIRPLRTQMRANVETAVAAVFPLLAADQVRLLRQNYPRWRAEQMGMQPGAGPRMGPWMGGRMMGPRMRSMMGRGMGPMMGRGMGMGRRMGMRPGMRGGMWMGRRPRPIW